MRPKMKRSWWQRDLCHHLQQWFDDLNAGLRPYLFVEAPPQHGKSETVTDALSWMLGHRPDLMTFFASYSDRLGARSNRALQRHFESPKFRLVFPEFHEVVDSRRFTQDNLPLQGGGYFRNTTVRGPLTGEGLDLGVVDDPVKNREEARSPTIKERTWDWFTDDYLSRFSDKAGMLGIMTRWDLDDLFGRIQDEFAGVKVVKYKAIAEEDEQYRKKGEALFPEHKPLDFLLQRKQVMHTHRWSALYQQSPTVADGGLFPVSRFQITDHKPSPKQIRKTIRSWDKAGTADGGAYSAGVLMHAMRDGSFVIEDVKRGQWGALDRERNIKQTAELDGYGVQVLVEQEPGSGGKESAEATIRSLAGWNVQAERATGDKAIRAEPYAAQVEGENVYIVRGEWNKVFIDEHETFPNGKYLDQVDAASAAFNRLAGSGAGIKGLTTW
ncbi:MAG: hypothetical protein FKY71_08175 [Spiribacter salinus]|uniref:Terminase large subunit gp17-like C-terminal domain-containing protein n=1 Tax=Spiribacter salinus TaxID=1335746 RepID=A0A540VS00_9GAMM|nr:MAG: hypothetical protein FKY71_08175 [Spiribacter salinus]